MIKILQSILVLVAFYFYLNGLVNFLIEITFENKNFLYSNTYLNAKLIVIGFISSIFAVVTVFGMGNRQNAKQGFLQKNKTGVMLSAVWLLLSGPPLLLMNALTYSNSVSSEVGMTSGQLAVWLLIPLIILTISALRYRKG